MKVLKTNKYKPGTPKAVNNGCECPVIDNHYGKGRPNGDYIYSMDCPLHTVELTLDDKGLQIN